MNSAVPIGCVLTSEAERDLLNGDPQRLALVDEWKALGSRWGDDLFKKIEERTTLLQDELLQAVLDQKIEPIVWVGSPDQEPFRRLTWDWKELPGDLSLKCGRVRSDSRQFQELVDLPLCFQRADWKRWLASRTGDAAPAVTAEAPGSPSAPIAAKLPTYGETPVYKSNLVPTEFTSWAEKQHNAKVTITVAMAEDAMRGPKDGARRYGGLLKQGPGLGRDTIREWVKGLDATWIAGQGLPPSRSGKP